MIGDYWPKDADLVSYTSNPWLLFDLVGNSIMMTDEADESNIEQSPERIAYRNHLVIAAQKSQESFDKTVISLSGGALGISFLFLKDVVGPKTVSDPHLLIAAWSSWGLSSLFILISHLTSHYALNKAIEDFDSDTIDSNRPGGYYSTITRLLNFLGAILFVAGIFCIILFANANLLGNGVTSG